MKRFRDLLWILALCAGVGLIAAEFFGLDRPSTIVATLVVIAIGLIWWRFRWRRRRRRPGQPRAPIPLAIRRHIYTRDGYSCIYCGRRGKNLRLSIDHIMPVALGGSNEIGNLVTACRACNLTKGAKLMNDGALRRFASERRSWANRQRRQSCLFRTGITTVGIGALVLGVWVAFSYI